MKLVLIRIIQLLFYDIYKKTKNEIECREYEHVVFVLQRTNTRGSSWHSIECMKLIVDIVRHCKI